MIIVGAKGFAKEVLEVVLERTPKSEVFFYDDVSEETESTLFGFRVLRDAQEAKVILKQYPLFSLGLGNVTHRKKLSEVFLKLGGQLVSVISTKANIGSFNTKIEEGCAVMQGVTITNNVLVKRGTLINLHCTIGHDSTIGAFCEISPGVHISGNCHIGNNVTIGTNATVLPGLAVGDGAVIGAGSVITKNVPPGSLVVGVPGKVIKKIGD